MEQNLPGVFPAHKKDGTLYYRASITYKNKHISLGSYSTALLAYGAYLEGIALLTDASLCLNDYFEYFLSPDDVLKFDIDDLFYYSSHKIMRRGRHFFVADYGMQVNIMNRYGIKNYAVKDRDYRFVNGDDLDFRYENIEILNTYHGVIKKETKKGTRYIAKIHINGNYTIGSYISDVEAAIAYNKAIDILKKAGVNKNFSPNYLENLSPSVYADIYTKLHISPKIKDYLRV